MVQKETFIKIKVTDWAEQYQAEEPDISTFEKAIAYQQQSQIKPMAMGRHLLIAQLRGDIKDDSLTDDEKMILNLGKSVKWSTRVASQRKLYELENGKKVSCRVYVGQVKENEDEEPEPMTDANGSGLGDDDFNGPEFATAGDENASRRAALYLEKRVPGIICERLKLIAVGHGDVVGAGDNLKREIDVMVARLVL